MKKPNRAKRSRKRTLFRVSWAQGTLERLLLALVTAGCLFIASWGRILPAKYVPRLRPVRRRHDLVTPLAQCGFESTSGDPVVFSNEDVHGL